MVLPGPVQDALTGAGVSLLHEDDAAWREHLARLAKRDGPDAGVRVRIVAGDSRADEVAAAFDATGANPISLSTVVRSSRPARRNAPHVHEQAVCITAHRFGTPNGLSDGLI